MWSAECGARLAAAGRRDRGRSGRSLRFRAADRWRAELAPDGVRIGVCRRIQSWIWEEIPTRSTSSGMILAAEDSREMGHPFFWAEFVGSSPQRTHSRRSSSTPAATAEWGSSASLASITTQNSSRRVAAARADKSKVVRPEEAGPQISVRHPRGRPPVRASMLEMPLETISGAGRISSREAGVMCANLGSEEARSAEKSVGRMRCGGRARGCPCDGWEGRDTSGTALASKRKGRPRAAEVETTAEDIRSSEDFRERRGWSRGGKYSLFIRLIEFCSGGWSLSSGNSKQRRNRNDSHRKDRRKDRHGANVEDPEEVPDTGESRTAYLGGVYSSKANVTPSFSCPCKFLTSMFQP